MLKDITRTVRVAADDADDVKNSRVAKQPRKVRLPDSLSSESGNRWRDTDTSLAEKLSEIQ